MILYLSSQQHTNLLDFLAEKEDALPVKKMTGNFMLKQFVIYDMRNFSHCTELVLDRIAFGDEDRDFAQAIEEFLTMYNARITVICEGLKESDPLCRALLDAGVGNIVTNVEIRGMQEEIRQSLSSQGMTRYAPKERKKLKVQGAHYHFMADGVRIAMISSQSRIGTTTMALGFAAWLGSVGASVAYIVDCVSLLLLSKAYAEFAHVIEDQSGLSLAELSFLGDTYSLDLLPQIYERLAPDAIGLTEGQMLLPLKTAALILHLDTNTHADLRQLCNTCSTCKNLSCPSRKSPLQDLPHTYGAMQIFHIT